MNMAKFVTLDLDVYMNSLLDMILGDGAYLIGSRKDPQTYVHAGETFGAQVSNLWIGMYLTSYKGGVVLHKLVKMCVDEPMLVTMPLLPW